MHVHVLMTTFRWYIKLKFYELTYYAIGSNCIYLVRNFQKSTEIRQINIKNNIREKIRNKMTIHSISHFIKNALIKLKRLYQEQNIYILIIKDNILSKYCIFINYLEHTHSLIMFWNIYFIASHLHRWLNLLFPVIVWK